jgi:stress response protein YsnF
VVPKERVGLGKGTVTEERTVEDDLRREKIDVDDDARKGA